MLYIHKLTYEDEMKRINVKKKKNKEKKKDKDKVTKRRGEEGYDFKRELFSLLL